MIWFIFLAIKNRIRNAVTMFICGERYYIYKMDILSVDLTHEKWKLTSRFQSIKSSPSFPTLY